MVYSKRSGKPRGYAFIEYEHERDMHCEYLPPAPCPLALSLLCCPSPFLSSVPHPLPARPDTSDNVRLLCLVLILALSLHTVLFVF